MNRRCSLADRNRRPDEILKEEEEEGVCDGRPIPVHVYTHTHIYSVVMEKKTDGHKKCRRCGADQREPPSKARHAVY